MDNPWYIVGGILVIVLLVGAPFLKRWLNGKARDLGEHAGRKVADSGKKYAVAQIPKLLDEIGKTLILDVPEDRAREIVAAAAAKKPKDFPAFPDGTFGIRFTEPDDTIVRLVPADTGTSVQIERFREHMGTLMFTAFWETFRKRITEAATAAGATATDGPVLTYSRGALLDGKNAGWTLSE